MIATTAIPKKNERVAARVVEGKALIRRPGRTRAKLMLIPGGDDAAATAEQNDAVRISWAAPGREATTWQLGLGERSA